MTEASRVLQIDRRAAMALNAFPPEDRVRIRSALGHLLGPAALEDLGGRIHRLPADEPLYSVRIPPDLRVIIARRGDTIAVVDVLRRGALESFAAAATPPAPRDDMGPPAGSLTASPVRPKPGGKPHRGARRAPR